MVSPNGGFLFQPSKNIYIEREKFTTEMEDVRKKHEEKTNLFCWLVDRYPSKTMAYVTLNAKPDS